MIEIVRVLPWPCEQVAVVVALHRSFPRLVRKVACALLGQGVLDKDALGSSRYRSQTGFFEQTADEALDLAAQANPRRSGPYHSNCTGI